MFLFFKVITSAMAIMLITEVAKRYSVLGGLIAVMPINVMLSLIWLHYETKNIKLLTEFTASAILGIIPTALFLVTALCLLHKNIKLESTILISVAVWAAFVFIQNKIIGNS